MKENEKMKGKDKDKDKEILNLDSQIKRIGGYLHRIIPITDEVGNVINHVLKPLSVEFKPRDLMQTIVGSTFLAIPVVYSEEAWNLGANLPMMNIYIISIISLVLLALFIYLNYYRGNLKSYRLEFVKRVLATYAVSLITVSVLLTLVDKAPWNTDLTLTIKRVVIVAFPAAMSATLTDLIK